MATSRSRWRFACLFFESVEHGATYAVELAASWPAAPCGSGAALPAHWGALATSDERSRQAPGPARSKPADPLARTAGRTGRLQLELQHTRLERAKGGSRQHSERESTRLPSAFAIRLDCDPRMFREMCRSSLGSTWSSKVLSKTKRPSTFHASLYETRTAHRLFKVQLMKTPELRLGPGFRRLTGPANTLSPAGDVTLL
jgi:hypothetical protein